MPKFLKQNLSLKVLCLLISVILWGALKYTAPVDFRNIYHTSLYIPVSFVNEPEGLVVSTRDETVLAEIKGSPDLLSALSPGQFSAEADLNGLKKGISTVDLDVKFPPGVTLTKLQPSRINVTLEPYKSIPMKISLESFGQPAFGYSVTGYQISPERVGVSGAESAVNMVDKLLVEANVQGINAYTTFRLPIAAYDKSGNELSNVIISPAFVSASFQVSRGYRVQSVSVVPIFSGNLPNDYELSKVTLVPPVVSLRIPDGVKFEADTIDTLPIDLSGLTKNDVRKIDLDLPDKVSVIKDASIKIYFVVTKKEKKK